MADEMGQAQGPDGHLELGVGGLKNVHALHKIDLPGACSVKQQALMFHRGGLKHRRRLM
jgi:hypothetical protein